MEKEFNNFAIDTEKQIRVRYEETDQMGVVYYGNYFTWFEVGRTELFRDLGIPYRSFEERGILLPVTEAECKYKSSAKYDDLVTIKTCISRLRPSKINFYYQIISQEGRVLAYGSTGHAFVDKTGRPVNLSKKDPELWKNIINLTNASQVE